MSKNYSNFWNNVRKSERCWTWVGTSDQDGYGTLNKIRAHRTSWEITNGPIPEGGIIHHKCRFRLCVNPDHLELTTHKLHPGSLTTINSQKDFCKRGHEFTEKNTYKAKNGQRQCRECHKLRQRNYVKYIK